MHVYQDLERYFFTVLECKISMVIQIGNIQAEQLCSTLGVTLTSMTFWILVVRHGYVNFDGFNLLLIWVWVSLCYKLLFLPNTILTVEKVFKLGTIC